MSEREKFEVIIREVTDKHYICYIPEIDTHFFACNFEEIEKVAMALFLSVTYYKKKYL